MEGHVNDDALTVRVPICWSSDINVDRNRARQLLSVECDGTIVEENGRFVIAMPDGTRVAVVAGPAGVQDGERSLRAPRAALADPSALAGSTLSWIGARPPGSPRAVRDSLVDQFQFAREDPERDKPGLRLPQIGAVHAVLGYWTTGTTNPGTVVMPTGTGKTETMVALFASARPEGLLIVVPSDALRSQIAAKLETFGLLQASGVIGDAAVPPVVGQLAHKLETAESACEFAEACNVIVTTPGALFASAPEVRQAFLATFSHLFVDEAHHVEAATWRQIREEFETKPVLQFTATPYREDGRQLVGKLVYAFPLRAAQAQGYFAPIDYIPVVDFEHPDRAIAEQAIEQLRKDLAANRDHVLMARVRRRGRADEIRALYEEIAPDLEPVVLYSKLPAKRRKASLEALHSRSSRVIVCVDMLGEGFDLPALKVAAIHDAHKSLGITLQFVGRFARVAGETIGKRHRRRRSAGPRLRQQPQAALRRGR